MRLVVPSFLLLLVVECAKIPFHHPQESLSDAVIFQYPEMLVEYFPLGNWSDGTHEQEELYAYALGMFLVYSDSDLFTASFDYEIQEIFSFDFNFTKFLALLESHFMPQIGVLSPLQIEKRTKLAGFCSSVLDVEKLRGVYEGWRKRIEADLDASLEGSALKVSLKEAHEMIARGAKSPLAVVVIDIAILRVLNLAFNNVEYREYIGANINGSLVACLLALKAFPVLSRNISKDIEGLFKLLPELRITVYEDVAKHLVGLIALLPECRFRKSCEIVLSDSNVGEELRARPTKAVDLLSHPLIEFTECTFLSRVEDYCRVRDSGMLRVFVNGCPGNVYVNVNIRRMHLNRMICYKGSVREQRVEFEKGLLLSFGNVLFGEAVDSLTSSEGEVLVASILPLCGRVLELFGRFAMGECLEVSEMNEIIYVQAAYGVFVAKAPQITVNYNYAVGRDSLLLLEL